MNKSKIAVQIFIFLLIATTATGIFLTRRTPAPTPTPTARPVPTIKPTPTLKPTPTTRPATPTPSEIKVYITGAVKNPGVYKMQPGDRIENALKIAGGPTDQADLIAIDLAKRVTDEMHLTIPTRKK